MRPTYLILIFVHGMAVAADLRPVDPNNPGIIEYISNLAGSAVKWRSFLQHSEIIARGKDGQLYVRPGCMFVYGGDVIDNAPGEMEVLSELVPLAERQPAQVRIVLGDRDINKMALTQYGLNSSDVQEYLRMVAPNLFEYHRQQLQALQRPADAIRVKNSLVSMLQKRGLLYRYLQAGVLATMAGGTLFVHGAFEKNSLAPPWSQRRLTQPMKDLAHSIQVINSWKEAEFNDWTNHIDKKDIGLLGYQTRAYGIVAPDQSWLAPKIDSADLIRQGIHRIVMASRGTSAMGPVMRERDKVDLIWGDNPESQDTGVTIVTIQGDQTRLRNDNLFGEVLDVSWRFQQADSPVGRFVGTNLMLGRAQSGSWLVYKTPGFTLKPEPPTAFRPSEVGQGMPLTRVGRRITEAQLAQILKMKDPAQRIEAFKQIDGYFLTNEMVATLVHQSHSLDNGDEIAQYIRMAIEKGTPEFQIMLQEWSRSWNEPKQNWQTKLRDWAAFAMQRIPCERILAHNMP